MRLNEVMQLQSFENFTHEMEQACSAYVGELRNMKTNGFQNSLVRGANDAEQYGTLPIRTDRQPRDTNPFISWLYDYGAEMQTGISQLRQKVVFTSGRTKTARMFGDPVYVFPINGTKYFYEDEVSDSVRTTDKIRRAVAAMTYHAPWNKYEADTISSTLERLMKMDGDEQIKFAKALYQEYPKILDINQLSSIEDLPDVVDNGDEIMLYGVAKYYYVDANFLRKFFQTTFISDAIDIYAKVLRTGTWPKQETPDETE